MAESPPQAVLAGRYVLQEEVARGGMATVWRAIDDVLARPVAVKILHEHLAENPSFRQRFYSEALAAARLSHPCIVNVFDTGRDDRLSYIVMELFDGETLAELLERTGPLDPDPAVAIMLPVLEALQYAHDAGVIHRDIKPANILVGSNGMVKVTDLGIARAAFTTADVTTTSKVLGSVPYLSPEQVQGSDVDARSDVYACGVVLYEMLTGRPPFAAETDLATAMMRITRDPVPPRSLRAGIPRPLEAVVMRALARHPQDRFPSAEAMAASLNRLRGTAPVPRVRVPAHPAPAPAHPPPEPSRGPGVFRSWMLVPLLAVVLAAAAIVAGFAIGDLKFGGPLGITGKQESPGPSRGAAPYRFATVTAFDPFGTDGEHDELLPNLTDGNPSTLWYTENYRQLDLAPKPGVGVLFDLGTTRTVGSFRLQTSYPGFRFQIRVGDDPQALASTPGPEFTASTNTRAAITGAPRGRYVLLWVTTVVPGVQGGNRAAVGEFEVFGPGG